MTAFRALFVDKEGDRCVTRVRTATEDELPAGGVTIRVAYSGVNYKDGLAVRPDGKIVTAYPFVPGIDLSGTVVRSEDGRFREGDRVLVTGYGLGVSHYGGYSELARVPADWVVPVPDGLSLREAMIVGTAGFTAALSIERLREHGVRPESGPVAVTGATGGVGSEAVALLAALGYEVAAGTGKADAAAFLRALGAADVLGRDEIAGSTAKPLQKERWAGAVDPVGGPALAGLLGAVRYGGAVAVSGLTGGADVPATVYPFILRGVSLLGIDSVRCPHETRVRVWGRLADEWRPAGGYEPLVADEIGLDRLPEALAAIVRGEMRGRVVVKIS
ncbi:acryloyl-CoA reductase [Paenibacillus flagellatus]|uniref:Oxidoreductase n=1 Tax=Paenibacillus flagellatus TaxID=2211139 RepID=A0A2V5KTM0_9BACL|nr:acryloyl-CoA reductase [Paenibacillus flagellatus]PYI52586.1 oxidoreductase [Paenibacillus flagellatus]